MELTQEQKDALLQYEEMKIAVKDLEAKMDKLKPIISPIITSSEKLKGLYGTFELKSKSKWTFSADVQSEETLLESMKSEEIAKGIAVNSPIVYFEYRKAKKSDDSEVEN